jgi:hypothetical protein
VAVFGLVLGTLPVHDVVAVALLTLHDPVGATWRVILVVVVEAASELPLLTFAVTLVDAAAGVATTPVHVEVGT